MVQRILFVDDEPKVLTGLQRMLRGYRREWDMHFCDDPERALGLVADGAYDIVVTDMRMPGMDGAELLQQVRKLHPEAVRIVLSGQSDEEKVMRAVGPAHQYLSKPCDPDILQQTIRRAGDISARLREPQLRSLVAGLSSLPSLPAVYLELVSELRREDASIDRVGELISQDVGMTAKVLQLVNSSFFGLPVTVRDAVHAATLLGVDTLRPLVLTAGVFRQLEQSAAPQSLVEEVLHHSLSVGCLARRICQCERADDEVASAALLGGVLHDIGKLILADHFGSRYVKVLRQANSPTVDLCELERQEFGGSHAAVGGFLVGVWGLPHDLVEAIAFHHDPITEKPGAITPLAAVQAANALAKNCEALGIDPFRSPDVSCERLPWRETLTAAPP